MQKKRIILTGGPGTGKTSIINALIAEGYNCFEEISREIIREEMAKGTRVLPWDNLMAFSQKVIDGRVEQYNAAIDGITFYDRSVYDSIAYLHLDKVDVLDEWDVLGKELTFSKDVFITPPWREIFHQDNERKESLAQLTLLHETLIKTYQDYGYTLIEVPRLSINERVQFILNHIKSSN